MFWLTKLSQNGNHKDSNKTAINACGNPLTYIFFAVCFSGSPLSITARMPKNTAANPVPCKREIDSPNTKADISTVKAEYETTSGDMILSLPFSKAL